MKRRLVRLVVFLLLGAIVNVAVAWACAAWSPHTVTCAKAPDAYQFWLDRLTQNRWSWRLNCGIGYEELVRDELLTRRPADNPLPEQYGSTGVFSVWCALPWDPPSVIRAGWPRKALMSNMLHEKKGDSEALVVRGWSVPKDFPGVKMPTYRRFPLAPIWPGFAINTLFYAAILWGLFAAPFALRRRRRIKRGLCPKCAYDLRGCASQNCPECGTTVKSSG